MEQVVGDFFLELNLLASNYGYFVALPYVFGVAASIYENVSYETKLNALDTTIKRANTQFAAGQLAITELDGRAASLMGQGPAPENSALAISRARQMVSLIEECDQLTVQLIGFTEAKERALNAIAVEKEARVWHKKVIAGSTVVGLVVAGSVWVFKALSKVFFDPTKA